MKSIGTFWFSFPILLVFLFHSSILNYFGLNMATLRGRSSLVRTMASKMEKDRELEEFDKQQWYRVDLDNISSVTIRSKFVQLDVDEETKSFIDHSVAQSDWFLTQLWYNVAKSFLSWFYCQTDINGILQRGSMFVFSREQFMKMTKMTETENETIKSGDMLDLGAGDGRPTLAMSSFYDQVFATEVSGPMRKNLAAKGFKVLEIEEWPREEQFDLIRNRFRHLQTFKYNN